MDALAGGNLLWISEREHGDTAPLINRGVRLKICVPFPDPVLLS